MVVKGIEALKAVWHRGAVDADGKTGDGAGIHVQIPQDFFQRKIKGAVRTDQRIAVGMVFLPRSELPAAGGLPHASSRARSCASATPSAAGARCRSTPRCWARRRRPPGPRSSRSSSATPRASTRTQFERDLYLIRRRIEKQALAENITDFYICSLSCRSVIYKGLFLAESLAAFYPDLQDERFVSSFALFHQRYSTNTMPSWKLAQPFRMLAHNGEINTLRGNVNWMKSHETRMVAAAFGEHNEDVKPIIQPGSSDSAALDAVCEALVRAGRQLPLVKTMLIPPAWSQPHGDQARSIATCSATATASWSPGTARPRIVATDSRWVVAGLDRSGLRPMRYSRTRDGLLVVGSETGMVPLVDNDVIEKGRVGPGENIAVDLVDRPLLPRPGAQGPSGGAQALQPLDGEHHPSRRALAGAARSRPPPTSAPSCAAARRSTASPSRTWS